MKIKLKATLLIPLLLLISCVDQGFDSEKYRQEVLSLHRQMINAHLEKDVAHFVEDIAPDYFQVQGGDIKRPSKQEIVDRFSNYLNNTTFTRYEDMREPIIGFSDDGSLAWIVVQVKIAGSRLTDGQDVDLNFTAAWITLYRREEEKWIRMLEVDNFR